MSYDCPTCGGTHPDMSAIKQCLINASQGRVRNKNEQQQEEQQYVGMDREMGMPLTDQDLPVPPAGTSIAVNSDGIPLQGNASPQDNPRGERHISKAFANELLGDSSGMAAEFRGDEAEALTAYVTAHDYGENPTSTDPFIGVDNTGVPPDGILQTIEVVAKLTYGHDRVSRRALFNLPAGQTAKLPIVGSYAKVETFLQPRYFPRIAVVSDRINFPAGSNLTYLNDDANLANNYFNFCPPTVCGIPLNYGNQSPSLAPITPVATDGIIGRGSASLNSGGSNDRSSRALRRFFGSYPSEGASSSINVFCPIAFGAAAVMLQCNDAVYTDANRVTHGRLLFGMQDHNGDFVAELPPNTFFPIMADCQFIFVYDNTATGAETTFQLVYDLGF